MLEGRSWNRSPSAPGSALLTLILLTSACAAPEPEAVEVPVRDTTEENVNAIRALVVDYAEAYNEANDQALAELYTEDAILMPPDENAVEGKLLIGNRYATIFASYDGSVQVNVDESRFSGDFGIARGGWALSLTPKAGGDPISEIGKWLIMMERVGGEWRISRQIWNRDRPTER